jgi:hypothetical protein
MVRQRSQGGQRRVHGAHAYPNRLVSGVKNGMA